MWVYWIMFALPALASIMPYRLTPGSQAVMATVAALTMAILIGLRHEIGADWTGYLNIFEIARDLPLIELILQKEAAFWLVNWVSSEFGWGMYGVNALCATIFSFSLIAFCRRQPSFWMPIALAMPVLVLQMAMSGVRQSVAIALLMLAMNAFVDRKLWRYFALVLGAVLFHQTAALFLVYGLFVRGKVRLGPLVLATAITLVVGFFVFRDPEQYAEMYIYEDEGAAGALPRVAMTVAAALVFLYFRRPWRLRYNDAALFNILAVTSLLMAPALLVSQVATDRMVQYLLPFQIAVFARMPEFWGRWRLLVTLGVLALYALMMMVWLNFSWIAQKGWVPYQSLLFLP